MLKKIQMSLDFPFHTQKCLIVAVDSQPTEPENSCLKRKTKNSTGNLRTALPHPQLRSPAPVTYTWVSCPVVVSLRLHLVRSPALMGLFLPC